MFLQYHAQITWKECAKLPFEFSDGKTTVIHGKVYFGGGHTDLENDQHHNTIIYSLDPSNDKWTALPPLPVRSFGLGQVNGKLVTVGGEKEGDHTPVKEIHMYDEESRKWKQTIPPMPTARHSPGVLSLRLALVVAGGAIGTLWDMIYRPTVEIFKPDTSQWYKTDSLPMACRDVSLVAKDNTCYALGGFQYKMVAANLNQALYASVDDLICHAVPADESTHNGFNESHSAWKTLSNTLNYQPTAALLADNLLAIGGNEMLSASGAAKKGVFAYSPSTNSWTHVSDLPVPMVHTAVATLSSTKILVIGGWSEGTRMNSVYMGTLA